MDFEGVIYKVLPTVTGTSARGEWSKQEVILEQPGEFPRKVCISFWGDKSQEAAALKEGEVVMVSANVESREYNDRWFTEVRGWRISRKTAEPAGMPSSAGMPPFGPEDMPSSSSDQVDDLPF